MPFRDIPGQDRVKSLLQSALRAGTLSHAYVFEGPRGTGRRATALTLAQALHCREGGGDACGVCAECRKIAGGNHQDVIRIDTEGAAVKIDQIRDLQKQFAYKTTGENPRVYIIEEAERLTPQAANALLKFLEEPTSATVALLLTENAQALLPTILSRAQRLVFLPLPPETMERALLEEGLPPALVKPAVRLASGLDSARELIQLNWFAEIRNAVLQLAKESSRGFAAAMLAGQAIAGKGETSEHLDTLFDLFALWCKDMILLQRKQTDSVVFIDQLEFHAKQAVSKPAQHWVAVMDEALRAKRRLRAHANPQLVLERFLYALQGGT
ncbi:DNA polymerase III subunit delta' [Paenibacillus sp.]|uniref:DNA polymerase III subunit delta' n=1 Tax=Paenibacillus sp. TaxID=58172 RepID=UPI002D6A71F3|nr:DNA polymerase III subunit delta' [Paenibacillus sp.]HZG87535.1 DNA polymerase III subunit delta' [Paenibacillus sp.]